MDDRHPEHETDEPEALARALRRAYRGRVDVPPEVDEAMRARAHLPFARIRRRRLLWLVVPAAAAATLAVIFYVGSAGDRPPSPAEPVPSVALHTAQPPTGPVPATPDTTPTDAAVPDVPAVAPPVQDATTSDTVPPLAETAAPDASPVPPPAAVDAGRQVRAEDFNRDGRVDIRDALAMARRLRTGGLPPGEWDLSGDGIVDRADVDRIARAVVAVEGGRP